MILNAYAVLDAFVTLLRMLFGLVLVAVSLVAWRHYARTATEKNSAFVENRFYLLFLLVLLLLALNVASWPLFYLLLQSYVTEWPGVMCIYGVTRIGAGSLGSTSYLPGLLNALQILKPALVFSSGAWFCLHLVNRRTQTAPLMGTMLFVLPLLGTMAAADATLEAAYLVIPKKEKFLSAGCCTAASSEEDSSTRFLPENLVQDRFHPWLTGCFYLVNGGMVLALLSYICRSDRWPSRTQLAGLMLGAALSWPVNLIFLIEIAAPALLHLPYHHCAYDLIGAVPESMVEIALFVASSFAVGWAGLVAWLADCAETRPFLGLHIRALLELAWFGYLASLIMISIELAIA